MECNDKLYCHLNTYLASMRNDPVVPLLTFNECSLDDLFLKIERNSTPEATVQLLHAILKAEVASTFYKINVHAALTPTEIKKEFDSVFDQAKLLEKMNQQKLERLRKELNKGKKKDSTSIPTHMHRSSSTTANGSHTPVVTVS